MNHDLTKEQLWLLNLLRVSLTGRDDPFPSLTDEEWKKLTEVAGEHKVIPLLYPVLSKHTDDLFVRRQTEICIRQYYRLLFLTRYYVDLLRRADVPVVVLKGAGASLYYPVPEYRKSGDIDLMLLRRGDMEKACRALEAVGVYPDARQHANHHVSFGVESGIELELHMTVTEDFDSAEVNNYLKQANLELPDHVRDREVIPGVCLPLADDGFQAFLLLLHMLQHFLRSGFGLRLLCDWVVFWNRQVDPEQTAQYLRLVRGCGIVGFSRLITKTCVDYLGLEGDRGAPLLEGGEVSSEMCRDFLSEVFAAQEFGHSSSERMVVLRGTGPLDYLREFHHQMRLNYPGASKCFLLWPFLWIMTLIRFLYNNHSVRKTSLFSVLRQAGQRSRLMEELKLFVRN